MPVINPLNEKAFPGRIGSRIGVRTAARYNCGKQSNNGKKAVIDALAQYPGRSSHAAKEEKRKKNKQTRLECGDKLNRDQHYPSLLG